MTIWQAAMLFRDEKSLGGTVPLHPAEAKAAVEAAKARKKEMLSRFGDPFEEPPQAPPDKPRRRRRRRRR